MRIRSLGPIPILTLALAALALTPACSPPEGEGGSRGGDTPELDKDWGPPVPGGQLVARYLGDASAITPVFEQSVADSAINYQVYPYLTGDVWADCENSKEPQLAASWEWSNGIEGQPGGRTLTYHLRDDVRWADGAPVTAEDVVFTYGLYSNASVASVRYSYTEKIASVRAADPHTVVFEFTEVYPPDIQLSHTGLGLLPEHILGDVGPVDVRQHPYTRNPVGAGPFRVTSWEPSQQIILERCEDCGLKPPAYLDRVIIKIIPEETVALVAMKRGNVDFMELSTYEPIEDIKKNHPEIRILRRGYRFLDYVGWNLKDRQALKEAKSRLAKGELLDLDQIPPHPLFGDRRVRRALTMAIDVPSIMEALTSAGGEVFGKVATGTITPELCKDYADITPLPLAPDRSRELLAEAGWEDSDRDGVLDKDGRPFRFTLNYNSGNQRRFDAAVYIQSMLKQVGVAVDIEPIESSVFFSNLRNKDYDAALAGWSAALFTDPTSIWHSGAEHPFNFTSYKNERVDEILESALYEPDRAKRREMWREMQQIIYEDQPYTFLFWMDRVALVHGRFQDVQSNILTVYHHLHEWWVPEELRKYE